MWVVGVACLAHWVQAETTEFGPKHAMAPADSSSLAGPWQQALNGWHTQVQSKLDKEQTNLFASRDSINTWMSSWADGVVWHNFRYLLTFYSVHFTLQDSVLGGADILLCKCCRHAGSRPSSSHHSSR